MSGGFSALTDDEVNDFYSVIEQYGFSKDDFELVEIRETSDSEEIIIIRGEIKVLRKSANTERVYNTGTGSTWPAEFEDDLKHGAFGQNDN